jgi:hypothetical protein
MFTATIRSKTPTAQTGFDRGYFIAQFVGRLYDAHMQRAMDEINRCRLKRFF